MDNDGLVDAQTPFFCNDYKGLLTKDINDTSSIDNDKSVYTLQSFRAPAGIRDFVADYQNPQQDKMYMFEPRTQPQFDCYNAEPVSKRNFPLFQPHYYKGGPYKNTLLNWTPDYPTAWAPQLEHIPMFHLGISRNSQMNNRQYGNGNGSKNDCNTRNILLNDGRMYPSSSFARDCRHKSSLWHMNPNNIQY